MVVSDVTIAGTAKVTIENGVEIIFSDDYTIQVNGAIILSDSTIQTDTIGLSNVNTFTYIHGTDTKTRIGTISIQSASTPSHFYNTKFHNMFIAISHHYDIINCEFTNNHYAIVNASDAVSTTIANSKFINNYAYDVYQSKLSYVATIQHNIFNHSNGVAIYIHTVARSEMYYNTFVNGNAANIIRTQDIPFIEIKWNTFMNNTGSNLIYDASLPSFIGTFYYVQYNNFSGNTATNSMARLNCGSKAWITDNMFVNNLITGAANTSIVYKMAGDAVRFAYNSFTNNQINGASGSCAIYKFHCDGVNCDAASITYNVFESNQLESAPGNAVIHIGTMERGTINIWHNKFTNNIQANSEGFNNIIYMYSDGTYLFPNYYMHYNDFNEANNIDSYLYFDMVENSGADFEAKWNNFHQMSNVFAFITYKNEGPADATLNYYGTTDDNAIQSKLNDACHNLTHFGALQVSPYYVSAVDIDNASSPLPSTDSIASFNCIPFDPYPEISDGTKMNAWYVQPVTLTVANSPYYVISHMTVVTTILVENGVEIVFLDDYDMRLGYNAIGTLRSTGISTSTDTNFGLANTSTYTWIHGNFSQSRIGSIGDTNGMIVLNNAKLENLNTAISGRFELDNVEITDCTFTFYGGTEYYSSSITDSYVHDVMYLAYGNYMIIDHIKAESFTYFSNSNGNTFAVRNSQIHGKGSSSCIKLKSIKGTASMAIYGNTIDGCYDAIYVFETHSHDLVIQYNNISNTTNSAIYQRMINVIIRHNNFVDNEKYDILVHYKTSDGTQILNNTFTNTQKYAVYVFGASDIEIAHNTFIANDRIRDTVINQDAYIFTYYYNHPSDIRVHHNEFWFHKGQYTMYFDRVSGTGYFIRNNRFISNIEQEYVIGFEGGTPSDIYIEYNEFITNAVTTTPVSHLLYLEGANYSFVNDNYFWRNYIFNQQNASLFKQTDGTSAEFLRNNITNNQLWSAMLDPEYTNNLLHFNKVLNVTIQYNEFNNNIEDKWNHTDATTNNIIYVNAANQTDIQYNNLHENEAGYAYVYVSNAADNTVSIQYNNFNEYSHMLYFIAWDNTIDLSHGNLNYFGGLTATADVSHGIYDFCETVKSGHVTFWPWYVTPIDTTDVMNLPADIGENVTLQYCATNAPTGSPTTSEPTTSNPTTSPTRYPTDNPSTSPTKFPTGTPTTSYPSLSPTKNPTNNPSMNPSENPTNNPSNSPSKSPSVIPSAVPTQNPSLSPTLNPSTYPTANPSAELIGVSEVIGTTESTVDEVADGIACQTLHILYCFGTAVLYFIL